MTFLYIQGASLQKFGVALLLKVGGSMGRARNFSPAIFQPPTEKSKIHVPAKMPDGSQSRNESQNGCGFFFKNLDFTEPCCLHSHAWNPAVFFFKHGKHSPASPSSRALVDR
jgi:hypothetical protein